MRVADPLIPAHQRRQRHALGRGEGRIPAGAMSHRRAGLAALVGVRVCGLVAHDLLPVDRVLAVGEAAEVLLADFSVQSPRGGELSMPLPSNPIAIGVVVVAGILELFRVITMRLAGAQGSGDREHRAAV